MTTPRASVNHSGMQRLQAIGGRNPTWQKGQGKCEGLKLRGGPELAPKIKKPGRGVKVGAVLPNLLSKGSPDLNVETAQER